MRARDVMTTEVVAVEPGTSAKEAAALLAERGFAALPVSVRCARRPARSAGSSTSASRPPAPREGERSAQPASVCFFAAAFCSCLNRRTSASDSGPVMSATDRVEPSSP